jgi:hypothetical protein
VVELGVEVELVELSMLILLEDDCVKVGVEVWLVVVVEVKIDKVLVVIVIKVVLLLED